MSQSKSSDQESVKRFLETDWLPAIQPTVRRTTFLSYSSHVENHIGPRIGRLALKAITGPLLNDFYGELRRSGGKRGPLSSSSVRRVHATLHRALRDAVRWGKLPSNPADSADPPREGAERRREMGIWTSEELRTFLDLTQSHPLNPLWLLLASTGMRRGEALGLCWRDVDFDRSVLLVRRTIAVAGADTYVSHPKTRRSTRIIAVDPVTLDTLRELRERGADREGEQFVFSDGNGKFLHPVRVSKSFRQLVAGTTLPRIRLHDLRHTSATLALEAGIHPKIVSERLGHSTVSFTLDVYSHAIPHLQEEAAVRLGDRIFGTGGTG